MAADEPGRTITLRDSRTLGYAEYGAPGGTPVMSFHGFPGSRITSRIGHEAAVRRGVRVIAPDRPGMGLSSYQPHRRMMDWPGDVAQLADALGLQRFAVMGVSGGGPYVAACALAIPDRLTAAAIVSGVGPMDRPGGTDGMLRMNKVLFGVQRRFPPAGRTIVWLQFLVMRRIGARGFERFAKTLPPADQAIASRPEVRDLFIADLREAFRHGARGAALENRLYASDWGFRLQDIRMPVHLWQGEDDRNVPLAHGRYQAEAIPDCRARFYPGEGHLLLVDRIDEIIDTLLA